MKKYSAPAAESVLDILEYLSEHPGPQGPTELTRQLEQSINLVFRSLNVLMERGYVQKDESGRYELGAKLFSLGMRLYNRFELSTQARPYLKELAANTMETCQLQIPDGSRMLSVACLFPPNDYYLAVTPGARLSFYGNAFGKAVMAFLPEPDVKRILEAPLTQMTPQTVICKEKIYHEFEEIRRTGIATEFEEYYQGGYCLSSPVFDASGNPIGGIGVSGLSSRLDRKFLPKMQMLVLECARTITASIGGIFPVDH